MKRGLLFGGLCLSILFGYSQKIEENKIDEFKKYHVIRTNWEVFSRMTLGESIKGGGIACYSRLNKVDDVIYLGLKIIFTHVTSVDKGKTILLKLDNDSVIELENPSFAITCSGCGAIGISGSEAQGVELKPILSESDISALLKHKVNKIRIYQRDVYSESDVKEKFAIAFQKQIQLIVDTK